jgi:hypothetical protein
VRKANKRKGKNGKEIWKSLPSGPYRVGGKIGGWEKMVFKQGLCTSNREIEDCSWNMNGITLIVCECSWFIYCHNQNRGVVIKVVKIAIRTMMTNVSSFNTLKQKSA